MEDKSQKPEKEKESGPPFSLRGFHYIFKSKITPGFS